MKSFEINEKICQLCQSFLKDENIVKNKIKFDKYFKNDGNELINSLYEYFKKFEDNVYDNNFQNFKEYLEKNYNDEIIKKIYDSFSKIQNETDVEFDHYLITHGFNSDAIDYFNIGFSPIKENILYNTLLKNYTKEELLETQLFDVNNNSLYFLKNKIIFPLRNENNQIVGFSGLDWKYESLTDFSFTTKLNAINQNELLYNLNNIKGKFDSVYIVKGILDVVALHNGGIKNVVALMSNEISKQQIQLLKDANIKTVILALDIIRVIKHDENGEFEKVENNNTKLVKILMNEEFNIYTIAINDENNTSHQWDDAYINYDLHKKIYPNQNYHILYSDEKIKDIYYSYNNYYKYFSSYAEWLLLKITSSQKHFSFILLDELINSSNKTNDQNVRLDLLNKALKIVKKFGVPEYHEEYISILSDFNRKNKNYYSSNLNDNSNYFLPKQVLKSKIYGDLYKIVYIEDEEENVKTNGLDEEW